MIVPCCDNAFSGSKNGEHLNELMTLEWNGRMKNENSINCDHKIQPLKYNELCMLGFPHMCIPQILLVNNPKNQVNFFGVEVES